ncbi:FxSxx-COOH system tetratricopeptide repeat protein [Actinoplanes sp. NPDC049599]|uniref:FxSxx-COOH system tetratricopeptide repeat protein n=1 Tax=Actinoplanes sp. NPDC049599 TaxID=3363903 RepID=UPI0037994E22
MTFLDGFIRATREAGLDLNAEELAEICWMARHLEPVSPEPSETSAEGEREPDPPLPATEHDHPPLREVPSARPPSRSPDRVADLRPHPIGHLAPDGAVPMRVAGAPTLVKASLARALRPLKRTTWSLTDVEMDESATVRQAADADLWSPVLVPSRDRWLDLAVVVDDAGSGPVWHRTVRDFLAVLNEAGVFRTIRVWRVDTGAPAGCRLTLRGETPEASGGRDPKELIGAVGRRAVLVISDCVGAAWSDGRASALLGGWAAVHPVAVVQLLPQRLWARCAPRFEQVKWRSSVPVTSNAVLDWQPFDRLIGKSSLRSSGAVGTPIPIVEMTGLAMSQWSRLVAGDSGSWLDGVALFTGGPLARSTPASDIWSSDSAEIAVDVRTRVRRFRAAASPQAFRLAALLAAAPLQLPVIRLVQHAMFNDPRPAHLAEVLLSGLVDRQFSEAPEGEAEFEFQDGVRPVLLSSLSRGEAVRVLHQVWKIIDSQRESSVDFLAILTAGKDGLEHVLRNRAFARVAVHVLRALGGTYAEKADIISKMLRKSPESGQNALDETSPAPSAIAAVIAAPSIEEGDPVVTTSGQPATAIHDSPRDAPRAEVWEVPRRTPYFTGRKDMLGELRQELLDTRGRAAVLIPRAIFGLGGVGKTALANEYAHRYGYAYDAVWWIPAEDPADVRRSLIALRERLKLPEMLDAAKAVADVLVKLAAGSAKSNWLLIYDNADDPERLAAFLPKPSRHGHVLITSRDRRWALVGAQLEVGVFARPESIALIRRRAPHLTEEDADRLAALVEDLPLAVNQAAAWHGETKLSAAEYLRRYDHQVELLGDVDPQSTYPRPVAASFGVSYDQLQERSTAATQLLQLCSHFGPEPISVEMLWWGRLVRDLPPQLSRVVLDRSTIRRELREIDRYELLRFDQARDRFQLHRLVQALLRTRGGATSEFVGAAKAQRILALANPGNPDEVDISASSRHAELSPHIVPSGAVTSDDRDVRTLVLDQIRFRYLAGDYSGGNELAEAVVADWHDRFGPQDELTLVARRHQANIVRALGNSDLSLSIDEEILAAFRETLGENNDHTLATANSLGADLRATGDWQAAHDLDEANLARHRRILRDDDPATLRTANNYAVDLRLLGRFREAEELDRSSVRLRTLGYGSDHPFTLFAISNLARDLYGRGEYKEALKVQQDALTLHEAVRGAGHPDVILGRRTVATLLRKLGRYEPALELAKQNFQAYLTLFGESHENTLSARMSLGNALRDGNPDREQLHSARHHMETAVALYQARFPDHPFNFVCQANYAIVLRHLGEVAQAREMNERVLTALDAKLGKEHPYVLCCATNLSNDMAAGRDYEGAYRLTESVLQRSNKPQVRGPMHPYTLGVKHNHALNLILTGREAAGGTMHAEVIQQFDATLGADHPDSLSARAQRRLEADIEPPPT